MGIMSKERQLRDLFRSNNLYYYCREPYDPTHAAKCSKRPKAQANALVLNDLDIHLTDEVLQQLEIEDALNAEFGSLSINALAGTEHGEAMRLRSLVKNKIMLMLLDSGSSHCFVSASFLRKVGINPVQTTLKQVKVAHGEILLTDTYVPNMEWWIQGHSFTTDMRVLDLPAYDAILGYDWLKLHSPITHNWEHKSMQFSPKGQTILLQGVQQTNVTLENLPVERMVKWWTGNDIWAMSVVDMNPPEDTSPPMPPAIQQVLDEFQDVFQAPEGLPPERKYDHSIPILPNAVPINSRPYRYSPLHKDEIERQVKELLAAGLITHSTSPYASPVLLVQKKMVLGAFV
jgi:hypothetical protein